MAVKKRDLREFLSKKQQEALKPVFEQERQAKTAFLYEWWAKLDPDDKLLKERWEAAETTGKTTDQLYSIQNKLNYRFWYEGINRAVTFAEYKDSFLNYTIVRNNIPGFTLISTKYGEKRDAIRAQYRAVNANLDRLSAKKCYLYLQELGFDVDSTLEDVPEYLPAIQVDKALLGIEVSK